LSVAGRLRPGPAVPRVSPAARAAAARGADTGSPPREPSVPPRVGRPVPGESELADEAVSDDVVVRSADAMAIDCGTASEAPARNAAAPILAANLTLAITAPHFSR
jgi:hypothetical protein